MPTAWTTKRNAQVPDRPGSPWIATTTSNWPPSTPRHGGTPITPTSYLDSLWRATTSQYRAPKKLLLRSGSGQSGSTLDTVDKPDGESDWVTDDQHPHPHLSRGSDTLPNRYSPDLVPRIWHCARCAWPVLENREDWMDETAYGMPEDIRDHNVSIITSPAPSPTPRTFLSGS